MRKLEHFFRWRSKSAQLRIALCTKGCGMDLNYFLSERLKFVQYFYENATKSFHETIRSIENQEAPYEPYYDESGEPQYLTEWLDAQTGVQSAGMAALSMYSSSLNVKFR